MGVGIVYNELKGGGGEEEGCAAETCMLLPCFQG